MMLKMSDMEKEILHRMPKGSCFLFDQNAIQNGKADPAYIEIDKLETNERENLSASIKRLEIGGAKFETAMPDVEIHMPQVSVYRFVVSMHRNKDLTKAIAWLRKRGLITSLRTLYGGSGMDPMIDRAKRAGFIDKDNKLTLKALHIVDPSMMLKKQGEKTGGEDHVAMIKEIILTEQDKGNFAFVGGEGEGFDIWSVSTGGRKGVWNQSRMKVFEIQTTAIRSEIDNCIKRQRARKYELIFVTNNSKTKKEIEAIVGGQFKVIKIKPYPDE